MHETFSIDLSFYSALIYFIRQSSPRYVIEKNKGLQYIKFSIRINRIGNSHLIVNENSKTEQKTEDHDRLRN